MELQGEGDAHTWNSLIWVGSFPGIFRMWEMEDERLRFQPIGLPRVQWRGQAWGRGGEGAGRGAGVGERGAGPASAGGQGNPVWERAGAREKEPGRPDHVSHRVRAVEFPPGGGGRGRGRGGRGCWKVSREEEQPKGLMEGLSSDGV